MERVKKLQNENHELIKLRDWLLPMLMNGQTTLRLRRRRCQTIIIMVYDHYRINQELENRGIKKRIRLFHYLDGVSRGKITFIDELDSNINDVYLDKLIEFFMYYSEVWLLRAFFLHMDGQILVRLNFGLLELKESLNNTTY